MDRGFKGGNLATNHQPQNTAHNPAIVTPQNPPCLPPSSPPSPSPILHDDNPLHHNLRLGNLPLRLPSSPTALIPDRHVDRHGFLLNSMDPCPAVQITYSRGTSGTMYACPCGEFIGTDFGTLVFEEVFGGL